MLSGPEAEVTRKTRDYRREYELRIARGIIRGFTRSQARGHSRSGEPPASPWTQPPSRSDRRLQTGVASFLRSGNLSAAAKESGVSAERLRRLVRDQRLAERKRGRLQPLIREMQIFSRGRAITVKVGFEAASQIGLYLNARGKFLTTNDALLLAPFEGRFIVDLAGKRHPFETDPNTLYELSFAGNDSFEQIYRLVIAN